MTVRPLIAEQRKEQRVTAAGEVRLSVQGHKLLEFSGRMLDSSQSGFRAAHTQTALSTGQRVRFHYSRRQGHALVMWNRILPDHIESGFLILDK